MDNMDGLVVSRRTAGVAAGVAVTALLVGSRLLDHGSATVDARPAARVLPVAAPRGPALVVHVVGAVRRPGLYRLRDGSRVADAVAKAGGTTRRADVSLVNLAAPAADGTQILVPARGPPAAGAGASAGAAETPAGPVHLNAATVEQLDALPGVGPVTAQKIVDYRQENGAFRSVDDLDAISGIGPARLEQLRELVAP